MQDSRIEKETPTRKKALLAGLSSAEKFLFVVVMVFILGLAFQFLGAFMASWIYGFELSEILSADSASPQPGYVAATKMMQIMGAIGTFILPALLFSYLFAGNWISYYQFGKTENFLAVLCTICMAISVIPFINYLAELNLQMEIPFRKLDMLLRNMEEDAEGIMKIFMSSTSLLGLLVNLFMIGVLAAIGEELIFRGLLQRLMYDIVRNPHVAIVMTAVLFSAFHFQFFSFLPRFFLGIVLGYLMYSGRSIWYPILAHFVNNALGVVYYYLNARGSTEDVLEQIGTSGMIPQAATISLLSFALFFGLWYHFVGGRANQFSRYVESEKD